ncbi:MAG: cysteine--tRNA ligase, partial [Candidatus Methanomethylophilus sp.]|nr:cysteine--tRNA ligase [Methanomethylophilus sp.]
ETKGADGKTVKMSKSLKNFFKVEDVAAKFDRYTIRFYYLNTHYRSPLTYGEENMLEAQAALKRLWNNFRDLQACARDGPAGDAGEAATLVDTAKKDFTEAMDDDFNTRAAIEALFALARSTNKLMGDKALTKAGAEAVLAFLADVDSVLGILPEEEEQEDNGAFDAVMSILIDLRKELRANKQYQFADMIRDRLKEAGYVLEDTSDGVKWKKI